MKLRCSLDNLRCILDANLMNLDEIICKFELGCQLDQFRYSLASVKIIFWLEVGGKIIPRIRLTSAKVVVEVEGDLGKSGPHHPFFFIYKCHQERFSKILEQAVLRPPSI